MVPMCRFSVRTAAATVEDVVIAIALGEGEDITAIFSPSDVNAGTAGQDIVTIAAVYEAPNASIASFSWS